MRIEGSVTALSWIPSESVTGTAYRVPFETGLAHYDQPPPDVLSSTDSLLDADRARLINRLEAWIEVEHGVIVDHGHAGRGLVGSTTLRAGHRHATFAAIAMPDRQRVEPIGPDAVRFQQTAGARTGVPAPRRVSRPPFIQIAAPLAWTTLSLTLRADGTESFELSGASPFPRHWVYDRNNHLAAKSATIDYHTWSTNAFGRHTPWAGIDSAVLVSQPESALERQLSTQIMRPGAARKILRLRHGQHLIKQGDQGIELFLLLDGIMRVAVNGSARAEVGPGAILGERAVLESGHRTASLTAITTCTVAVANPASLDTASLEAIADTHGRGSTVS